MQCASIHFKHELADITPRIVIKLGRLWDKLNVVLDLLRIQTSSNHGAAST